MRVLSAAYLVLVTGCLVQPFDAECEGATCDECAELRGCGWCRDLGCVPGDSDGADFLCPQEDWGYGTCLLDCEGLADCSSCAQQNGCGWCFDRCERGDAAGPRDGTCAEETWFYESCCEDWGADCEGCADTEGCVACQDAEASISFCIPDYDDRDACGLLELVQYEWSCF